MAEGQPEGATFRAVFQVREFRALWCALVLSIIGDQLARVALTFLVYARTRSTALTALTYALTFLPDLIGGPLLSGLADRYPRRQVMVAADVARAGLVVLMAIPGMPLPVVSVLLVLVQLLASPFNAARGAVVPAILDGDLFFAGQAVFTVTYQSGQLAGYLTGGVLVSLTGSEVALLIDAGTFLASALLVRFGLRDRPVPARTRATGEPGTLTSLRAGLRLVLGDPLLRSLVGLACLSGFYVIGEGLAVPYAHELGGGALTSGLLFAALPAGNALGTLLLTRLVSPPRRLRLVGPLAVLAPAVLALCLTRLDVTGTVLVLAASAAAAAYQTVAGAAFIRAVPDAGRGQAFGLANMSIRVAQGLGVVLAGAIAERLAPSLVVAVFGTVGAFIAVIAAMAYRKAGNRSTAAASAEG